MKLPRFRREGVRFDLCNCPAARVSTLRVQPNDVFILHSDLVSPAELEGAGTILKHGLERMGLTNMVVTTAGDVTISAADLQELIELDRARMEKVRDGLRSLSQSIADELGRKPSRL